MVGPYFSDYVRCNAVKRSEKLPRIKLQELSAKIVCPYCKGELVSGALQGDRTITCIGATGSALPFSDMYERKAFVVRSRFVTTRRAYAG